MVLITYMFKTLKHWSKISLTFKRTWEVEFVISSLGLNTIQQT